MCNKGRLYVLMMAVGMLGCVGNVSWASAVPSEAVINLAGLVGLTDGRDQDMQVNLRITGGWPRHSGAQFGYMTGDACSPATHGRGKNKNVTLPTNAPMDFALRYRGADNIFGSADDVFYRLSDSPNYASQYCFDPIRPYASSDPASLDFARLILAWDTNRDRVLTHPRAFFFVRPQGGMQGYNKE